MKPIKIDKRVNIQRPRWGGKRIFTAALKTEQNQVYMEGLIRGWSPLSPAEILGQFQAIRLGVSLFGVRSEFVPSSFRVRSEFVRRCLVRSCHTARSAHLEITRFFGASHCLTSTSVHISTRALARQVVTGA